MTEEARRKIAFAVGRAVGRKGSSIYSYTAGSHSSMQGQNRNFYDYGSGSHFTDSYDYASGSHWKINVDGDRFKGYHYGDGHHFTGKIRNGSIQMYDYGDGSWHTYTI